MYIHQTNKSALRSQSMIAKALLTLMKEKPFAQITVTEICEEAEVGRKTFYRNFELKEDVIDYQLDCLCSLFEQEIEGKSTDEKLKLYFSFSKEHVDFFSCMYQSGLLPVCQQKFSRFLPDTMPIWSEDDAQQEYYSRFMSAGVQAMMQVWVERGFREDIEQITTLAQKIQNCSKQ